MFCHRASDLLFSCIPSLRFIIMSFGGQSWLFVNREVIVSHHVVPYRDISSIPYRYRSVIEKVLSTHHYFRAFTRRRPSSSK